MGMKQSILRIAGILDELSVYFWQKECNFLNLSVTQWRQEVEQFEPNLLFIESAWKGRDGGWYQKVARPSTELEELLEWCKEHKIITVFWNKEDPIHFSTFLRTAFLFDWVFTTDLDCIPLYQRLLKHQRVGLMLFSASTQLFHPIENKKRKEAICFAADCRQNGSRIE